jgi:hypothetical protein
MTYRSFEDWIAVAFPWLGHKGADYRNLRAAWDAGWKAAREAKG